MQSLKASEVHPVPHSEELLHPGDYVFVAKRPPSWPEYDAVILMCPYCNNPVATMPSHTIESQEPLTISEPIACPYSPKNSKAADVPNEPPKVWIKRLWWNIFGEKTHTEFTFAHGYGARRVWREAGA
jgi:hypothetical protein